MFGRIQAQEDNAQNTEMLILRTFCYHAHIFTDRVLIRCFLLFQQDIFLKLLRQNC